MPRPPARRVGLGEDHVVARRSAVADPVLLAAQPPAVAFAGCRGLDRGGIRAGVALGERKARCHALRHLAEVALLLIVSSGQEDRKGAELVGAQDRRRRGAAGRDRLDHRHGGAEARALAAILLRDEQARQIVLDQPAHVLPWVALLAVELLGQRRKMLARDAIRHCSPAPGLFAQGGLPNDRHMQKPELPTASIADRIQGLDGERTDRNHTTSAVLLAAVRQSTVNRPLAHWLP